MMQNMKKRVGMPDTPTRSMTSFDSASIPVAVVVSIAEAVVTVAEAMIVAVPVAISPPLVPFTVPVGMVPVIATLAFAVQVAAAVQGLVTEVAVVFNGVAQPPLRALDALLAASSIVRLRIRCCSEKRKRSECDRCHGDCFSEFCKTQLRFQGFLLQLSTTLIKMPALVFEAIGRE
jgi:hypothetical protein